MFFSPDSAEPFRFKLRCLEAELHPSKHVAIFIRRTLVGRIGVNPGELVLVYGGLNKRSRAKNSKHRPQAWNQLLPPVLTIQAPKNHEFVIKDVEKKGQETVPVLPQ